MVWIEGFSRTDFLPVKEVCLIVELEDFKYET